MSEGLHAATGVASLPVECYPVSDQYRGGVAEQAEDAAFRSVRCERCRSRTWRGNVSQVGS